MGTPADGLVDLTYRRLMEMLVEPQWVGGGRLPPEERLTRALGVSRRVLREALARLRREGRIQSRRGSGNYVVPSSTAAAGAIDFGAIAIRSLADVENCLRFRCAIEVAAAAAAAEHRSDEDLLQLENALDTYDHCLTGAAQFDADCAFHLLLARASGNVFFAAALEGLRPTIQVGHELGRRMRHVPLNEPTRVATEHGRIFKAVCDGNPAAAQAAMEAHLISGIERLFGKGK